MEASSPLQLCVFVQAHIVLRSLSHGHVLTVQSKLKGFIYTFLINELQQYVQFHLKISHIIKYIH